MTVSPVSPVGAAGPTSLISPDPVRAPKQTMDSSVFMSLLVAQLKNQDPSSPMDTNAMIAQTTQLAMMEKLTQIAQDSTKALGTQQRSAAAALLGRSVTYLTPDGVAGSGTAISASYSGSTPTVVIGGVSVPVNSITGIVGS